MKNSKRNLVILFVLSLVSCAQIKIKDQIHCGDAGQLGATCFHTLTDETFDLSPAEWEEQRKGKICTDASNYADNVATILKACRACNCCTYDEKRNILKFNEQVLLFQKNLHQTY